MAKLRFWNRRNEIGFPRVPSKNGPPGAPLPPNEEDRLAALKRYGILDTPAEPTFERLTCLAARLLHAPIALIALVDERRQWFKSCHGLGVYETERDVAFCAHTILNDRVMVVPDATKDSRFAKNPLVTAPPHFRFYAGAPLRTADGFNLGTICVMGTSPRAGLSKEESETLSDLAAIVVDEMELRLSAARIHAENTARRHAEEALRAANQELIQAQGTIERERKRYQELFNFAPDGYLVTETDGTIGEANVAAARMLNIPPERLAGKPVLDFVAEQERHDFRTQLRRLQTVDRVSDWEVRLKPRGGTAFFAALTGAAVRDSEGRVTWFHWIMRDITERKRAEQERRRLLTDAAHDHAVLLLDGEGNILSWTADAERITGWSEDRLQGRHVSILYPPDDPARGKAERSIRMASSEGRFDEEGWYVRSDGFRFWARTVIVPTRDAQGRRTGFTCVLRDLTQFRQTDETGQTSKEPS